MLISQAICILNKNSVPEVFSAVFFTATSGGLSSETALRWRRLLSLFVCPFQSALFGDHERPTSTLVRRSGGGNRRRRGGEFPFKSSNNNDDDDDDDDGGDGSLRDEVRAVKRVTDRPF